MTAKFLCLWVILLALAVPASAQFTIVSGTVTDPNGAAYKGASLSAQLIVPGGTSPTLNGAGFTTFFGPLALDTTGSFTLRVADNSVILPAGTQWQFTVCPGVTEVPGGPPAGAPCFSSTITISGATQSISTTLSNAASTISFVGTSVSVVKTNGGSAIAPVANLNNTSPASAGCNIQWQNDPSGVLGAPSDISGFLGFATGTACGSVSAGTQTFAGAKTFNNAVTILGTLQVGAAGAASQATFVSGAAPAAPAAGNIILYSDSAISPRTVNVKNEVGTVSNTVVPFGAVANNFLTALSSSGVLSSAQPSFSNLSGSIALGQTPLTTGGDLLFANATPVLARLGIGLANQVLTVSGGLPVWATPLVLVDYQKAAAAITGTGADVALYSKSIAGGTMPSGACLSISVAWQHTTGTASTTYKLKYGGTLLISGAGGSTAFGAQDFLLCNDPGVTNSQQATGTTQGGTGAPTGLSTTGTSLIDSTVAQTLEFDFNVAATDAVTPKVWLVRIIK